MERWRREFGAVRTGSVDGEQLDAEAHPAAALGPVAGGPVAVLVALLLDRRDERGELVRRQPQPARGQHPDIVGGIASGAQITAYIRGGTLGSVLTPREVFALGGLLGLLAPLLLGRRVLGVGRRVLGAAKVPGDTVPTSVAADCAA